MNNCLLAFENLLFALNIKFSKRYLQNTLLSHAAYPSLLSFSDTLEKYGIDSLAVKVDAIKLGALPFPAIVQVSVSGAERFYVLKDFSEKGAVYQDDENNRIESSKDDFLAIWTGVCLLVDVPEHAMEPGMAEKLARKGTADLFTWAGITVLALSGAFVWLVAPLISDTVGALYSFFYMLLKLLGLSIGTMLLWYEVDRYHPTLQAFCSGGKGMDCDSVLSSRYAHLFRGNTSLGAITFAYFFGSSGYLLFSELSGDALSLLGFFSFATLPGVLASLYYQAVVIGQWCKFCIAVQVVLAFEMITAVLGSFYKLPLAFDISLLPVLIALFFAPILIWKWAKPLLESKREVRHYKEELKKLKNNPAVLNGLLASTKRIGTSTEGLGISIKGAMAKYNVVKVCNPYCGPCSKAHSVLDKLVDDNKINLQILYTANTDDRKAKPIRHFLAIDAHGNTKKTREALGEWYHTESKDYDVFAEKYPVDQLLEQQDAKIDAMREWCRSEKITTTPTIFINGRKMPKEYNIEDLGNVLA